MVFGYSVVFGVVLSKHHAESSVKTPYGVSTLWNIMVFGRNLHQLWCLGKQCVVVFGQHAVVFGHCGPSHGDWAPPMVFGHKLWPWCLGAICTNCGVWANCVTLRVGLVFRRILALVVDLFTTIPLIVSRFATIVASILHVVDLRIGLAGG